MVDTAGKKLKQARLRKQLSLEEAARATKIRVPRLADIENDDYTNFPSMAYVRGFLTIYSKYLGVDVSEYTETLGSTATSVGIGDYEYLSNAPERSDSVTHRGKPKRSLWPLVLIGMFLGMALLAAVILSLINDVKRIGNLDERGKRSRGELEEAALPSAAATPAKAPEKATVAEDRSAKAAPDENIPVRRAQAVTPDTIGALPAAPVTIATAASSATPATPATPASSPASPTINEVVVKAVKKIWVKISKDDPGSVPIYEDWLYPDTLPLKLRGTRFYIQMSDTTGLKVTKNGVSQPVDQSSLTIQ